MAQRGLCPQCGHRLAPPTGGYRHCSNCGTWVAVGGPQAQTAPEPASARSSYTPRVVDESKPGGPLVLVIRPLGLCFTTFFRGLVALAWIGFLVFWNMWAVRNRLWPMLLFGLVHDFIGLVLLWKLYRGLFHWVRVEVKDGRLRRESHWGLLTFKQEWNTPKVKIAASPGKGRPWRIKIGSKVVLEGLHAAEAREVYGQLKDALGG